MFAKFIVESNRDLKIQSKADFRITGQWSLIIGAVLTVIVFGIFLVFQIEEILIAMILPGACLLIGFIFSLLGVQTVFDKTLKEVRQKGNSYNYDNFDSVMVTSYIQTVNDAETQRFSIALIQKNESGGLTDKIDQMDKFIGALSNDEMTEEKEDELIVIIKDHHMKLLGLIENAVELGDYANEMIIWQIAEKIAKEVNVPLIDTCGENLLYRQVDELDMSLKERLQKKDNKREFPENKPDGIEENLSSDLKIIWSFSRFFEIGFIALIIIGFVVGGYFMGSVSHPLIGLVFYPFAVLMIFVLKLLLKGHGENVLTITNDSMSVKLAHSKPESVPLNEVEMLRINSTVNDSINIMTDKKMIKLPMKVDTAEWVVERVEYYLINNR
jgi:hypothetical protein